MAEKVIYHLLSNDVPLTNVVSQSSIMSGTMPLGTNLPAIAYSNITGIEETAIGLTAIKQRARIQVTIAANSYPEAKNVLGLVVGACSNKRGVFNGVVTDSIIKSLVGPDFRDDETDTHYQTVDFYITYE